MNIGEVYFIEEKIQVGCLYRISIEGNFWVPMAWGPSLDNFEDLGFVLKADSCVNIAYIQKAELLLLIFSLSQIIANIWIQGVDLAMVCTLA